MKSRVTYVFPRIFKQGFFVLFLILCFAYLEKLSTWRRQSFSELTRRYGSWKYPSSSLKSDVWQIASPDGWSLSKAPAFCKRIVDDPKGSTGCPLNEKSKLCEDGSAEMFSQFHQDYYLYTRHFSKLNRRGIYVDLAANHPWKISNSFFMDACLGWDGLCIEAHPKYTKALRKHRNCKVVPRCISKNQNESIMFVLNGATSGAASTNKFMGSWKEDGQVLHKLPMICTNLGKVFQNNNISFVDYLSLDVEGHELMILQGINWKRVVIDILSIELSSGTKESVEYFMMRRGYTRHIPNLSKESKMTGFLKEDGIYVRDGVIFGAPASIQEYSSRR